MLKYYKVKSNHSIHYYCFGANPTTGHPELYDTADNRIWRRYHVIAQDHSCYQFGINNKVEFYIDRTLRTISVPRGRNGLLVPLNLIEIDTNSLPRSLLPVSVWRNTPPPSPMKKSTQQVRGAATSPATDLPPSNYDMTMQLVGLFGAVVGFGMVAFALTVLCCTPMIAVATVGAVVGVLSLGLFAFGRSNSEDTEHVYMSHRTALEF